MKKISVMVKQVLMSTLTVGLFAFSISSCSDEIDSTNAVANGQETPQGAMTELLEAYGLTFENFDNADDVMIVDADTTQLSISRAYAEKMGITSFVNHPLGIWHKVENLPYIRKATGERIAGDRFIVDVVPATVAEIMGDKKVNLMTDIYVNKDTRAVKTRAAGNNIPEYAAKYMDDNNVLHPAYIHFTDPYGYDKEYHTADDKPSAAQTRAAATGEYKYMSADEIAAGKTRWGCHNRIIAFEDEMKRSFKLAAGKESKDSVYATFKGNVDFGVNYFLNLEGGVKWDWIIPNPYLKKFEAGLDGNFGFGAELTLGFTKQWELDEDDGTVELFKFKGYTFTFWVGPIPVAIVSAPHIDLIFDAKIGGKLETSLSYEYANKFKAGFGWADGRGFYPIKDFTEEANDLTFTPPHLEIFAEAGVGIYLVCDLKIYGLAGPKLGVGPRLGAELKGNFSPAEEKIQAKGKIGLTINAVIGAKVEVLGYKLADTELTFPLIPDKEWVLWTFNWDLKDALHKSPAAKKQEEQENKFRTNMKAALDDQTSFENYERIVTMLCDMESIGRQQAEQNIHDMIVRDVSSLDYSQDNKQIQADMKYVLDRYNRQMTERYNAFLIEKSWNEVADELKQCPAYIENARHWRTYRMDINMDFLHNYFVRENNREPAKIAEDLQLLAYYVLTYSKVVYVYSPGYRSKFTGVLENLMKHGKALGRYNDKQIELAAYETMLEINMRYPASSFANLPWTSDPEHPAIERIVREYEWQLDRVKY